MYPGIVLVLGFLGVGYAVLLAVTPAVAEALSWWSVGGAILTAALSMGAYLARAHPRLRAQLQLYPAGDSSSSGQP